MADCKSKCDCGGTASSNCSSGCVSNNSPASVYACAGASNVGKISFDLAIALHNADRYKMGCAVCVGAGDCGCGGMETRAGKKDLLIDGCKVACLKTMFEKKGITGFNHVVITQLGVKKEATFSYNHMLLEELMDKLEKKGW